MRTDGGRATVGGRPARRPHESSSFIGRRLRVDAVKHRADQGGRLRLVDLFQPGLVGVDAELPRELGMLLNQLGQQLLLPGGDRRARRLGLVRLGGVSGRLRVESEEGTVVGPRQGLDLLLKPAEADLRLRCLCGADDGPDDDLAPGLPLAFRFGLMRLKLTQLTCDPLVGILRPGRNLLAPRRELDDPSGRLDICMTRYISSICGGRECVDVTVPTTTSLNSTATAGEPENRTGAYITRPDTSSLDSTATA